MISPCNKVKQKTVNVTDFEKTSIQDAIDGDVKLIGFQVQEDQSGNLHYQNCQVSINEIIEASNVTFETVQNNTLNSSDVITITNNASNFQVNQDAIKLNVQSAARNAEDDIIIDSNNISFNKDVILPQNAYLADKIEDNKLMRSGEIRNYYNTLTNTVSNNYSNLYSYVGNIYNDLSERINNISNTSGGSIGSLDPHNDGSVVIGSGANGYKCSTVVGNNAYATFNGVANGYYAKAYDYSVANGYDARASNESIAVGLSAYANEYKGVAIGYRARGYYGSVTIGYESSANRYGIANGYNANAYDDGIAIGHSANVIERYGVSIGTNAKACEQTISIGGNSYANNYSIAIGYDVDCNVMNAIAIGRAASSKDRSVAMGDSAQCGDVAVAVGMATYAAKHSVVNGYNATANKYYTVAIGSDAQTFGYGSTSVGYKSKTSDSGMIVLASLEERNNYRYQFQTGLHNGTPVIGFTIFNNANNSILRQKYIPFDNLLDMVTEPTTYNPTYNNA